MNITALHVHASKQTSVCMNTVEYTGAQTHRLQAAAVLCTRAEETSPPNCDLLAKKCLFFNTGMWVLYFSDSETVCILTLKGCVLLNFSSGAFGLTTAV